MSPESIIEKALDADVILFLKDGKLSYRARSGQGVPEELRREIVAQKAEIVAHLLYLADQGASAESLPPIVRRERDSDAPLSYGQQQLMFVDKLGDGSQQFNIQGVFRVDGTLDGDALCRAINRIVARHEILRTNIVELDGKFFQFVNDDCDASYQVTDLSGSSISEREKSLAELIRQDAEANFDLEQDVMLRVHVVKLAAREHAMIFCMHHIASDGWSLGVLIKELKMFYSDEISGIDSSANELSVQYSDFAYWQRDLLSGPFKDKAVEFWKEHLKGIPETHSLPIDGVRSTDQDFSAIRLEQNLEDGLVTRLKAQCIEQNTTLFMLLQTAFSLLLHRFSHEEDIVVGAPMSGRIDAAMDPLIGLFINTVVLRNQFDSEKTFSDHLEIGRDNNLAIHDYQYLPFELLVEELNPVRNRAYSPVFQVWFVLQNNEQVKIELPGCSIRSENSESVDTAKYELNLYVTEVSNGLSVAWVARQALFKQETVAYLMQQFEFLLELIANDPEQRIGDYPIFESGKVAPLLDRLENRVELRSLLSRFKQQVEERPESVALCSGDSEISYRELDAISDRFAVVLAASPQERVGLCLNHGEDMVVAIWACIKSGKVYVPLNPEEPLERLRNIVDDAGVEVVVRNRHTKVLLADLGLVSFLDIDVCRDARLRAESSVPEVTTPEFAYILYTSGSTGKPKGVMQRHDCVAYYVECYSSRLHVNQKDRLLQVASFSHDAAVLDMFSALTSGACLQLMDIRRNTPDAILTAIDDGVTIFHASASVFKYLFTESGGHKFTRLRAAILGGEAPDMTSLRLAERCLPDDCLVANLYGSTEATLVSLNARRVRDGLDPCRNLADVVPGSRLSIVDEQGQPADVYQAGELLVESPFIADGYLNQRALTENYFSDVTSGVRSYHTGDMGYLLPDGAIRFLGRRDNQFKLNGQRIESEEIETVLMAFPQIQSCVVVPKPDEETGDIFVAAFVISDLDEEAWLREEETIRQHLAATLPHYMVPSVINPVEALLYTANGKIDRKGMRKWPVSRKKSTLTTKPRSKFERELAEIWSQVLGADELGVEDDFFALGGNSFKSLQIISGVARRFGVDLSLREFFDDPTVAACSRLIESKMSEDGTGRNKIILAADRENIHRPFPLTGIQQAYWLGRGSIFELGNVATQGYVEHDIPGYDHTRMKEALRRIIARHDMLRVVIEESGEQRILENVPEYEIQLFDYAHKGARENERHLATLREEMRSQVRSVECWPIFDFRVTRLPDGVGRLHVCTDAIIMDARSRAILVRELLELYLDPQKELPKLEISFRDYVLAESRLKLSDAYRSSRKYWIDRINSLPKAPELPLAMDASQLEKPVFVRRNHRLDKTTWDELSRCAAELSVTPICLLITAFSDILAYWSAHRDFTLNLTLFNRLPLHEQVEQLVGDFTSSSLLEVHSSPGSSFIERVKQTQRQLLSDIDHRLFNGIDVIRELVARGNSVGAALMPVVFTGLVGFRQAEELESPAQRLMSNGSTVIGATQTSQVYLDCQVYDDADSIAITWNCVDDLFYPGVPDDMFAAYMDWLENLARDSGARHHRSLQFLPSHQQALIDSSNNTEVDREPCLLHDLFARNVPVFGSAPAVIASEVTLSYEQLDHESNLLAARLVESGVVANQHVAVLMRKGWQQVVAVVAILKAGGAYLPIDANLPQQRIDYLLSHTGVRVVLTQDFIDATELAPDLHVEHVVLRGTDESVPPATEENQKPEDLAYTIFTSGSTGVPKGVMINHAGATNTILDINRRFAVGPEDRIFAISELNFDLSVYDIFGALAAGAALVIPEVQQVRDPQAWLDLLKQHSVTIWNSVPALAKLLFDALPENGTDVGLRAVMMSGDWIPLDLPVRIRTLLPDAAVYSLGGATEASIWSVGYPVETISASWRSIPYGKPLENQTMKILNAESQPCPLWVRGDLFIGGSGVALGYFGDEEKTRASFVPDSASAGCLYRTGDLARWMDDGNIEFLGREDTQVKINGYRIELGEIESQLGGLEGIKEAVVIAMGGADSQRLVAYVVPADPGMLQTAEWQEQILAERFGSALKQVLPAYMVPDVFVPLPGIPLTANGKVDRLNLPAPESSVLAETKFVAPETQFEEEVIEIWREFLQKDVIGATDNFFSLGGNSILAVRVIMTLREKYDLNGEDFQFDEFFSAATVREVAAIVENLVLGAESRRLEQMVDSAEYDEAGLI